jgi:hypothetical protein
MKPSPFDTAVPSASESAKLNALLARVQGEFMEMPGLRLTEAQARRLWSLDTSTCTTVLETLIAFGFLFRTRDGAVMRVEQAEPVATAPACRRDDPVASLTTGAHIGRRSSGAGAPTHPISRAAIPMHARTEECHLDEAVGSRLGLRRNHRN